MLDYIYLGEVQVQQEYLDRFLEIATKFKLSGLLTTDGGEEREEFKNEYMQHAIVIEDSVEETSIKPINQTSVENVAEIDQKFAELIEKEEYGLYRCTVCEKKIKNKRDMKRHIETHLSGLSYDCPQCGKNFRSSNSLRLHVSNKCSPLNNYGALWGSVC